MEEVEKLKNELKAYKSFITKAYNKTETEIDALVLDESGEVSESAFENLLQIDTAKVKKLKGDGQGMFDKGYQKAEAEIKTKVEKSFKEKTGFDGDYETTEDLFDAFITENAAKPKTKLTDDDVKKHPAYLALEKERVPKSDLEKVTGEFETYKQSVARNEKMSGIKSKVKNKFETFNVAPIENPVVKNKRLELFLKEFDDYDYEMDGENIIIIKDGKRLEDDHGNLIPLDDLISKKVNEHFEILVQSPKGGAGQQQQQQQQQRTVLKDESDYQQKMKELDTREANERDPAKRILIKKERIELGNIWMDSNKG